VKFTTDFAENIIIIEFTNTTAIFLNYQDNNDLLPVFLHPEVYSSVDVQPVLVLYTPTFTYITHF